MTTVNSYFLLFVGALAVAPSLVAGANVKFSPRGASDKCLAVANGATGDGLVYSMLTCDSSSNWQKFEYLLAPINTVIQLTSLHTYSSCSPQCIDVVAGSGPQRVISQPCNTWDRSQFWVPAPAPVATAGYTWMRNLENGLCLTAENLFGGDYVDTFACSGGALHQNWKLESIGTNQASVTNQMLALTTPCLTVDLANPYAGAATTAKACAPITPTGYHQAFYTYIWNVANYKNVGSGKCLDGGGGAQTPYQYTCTPSALNHQWVRIQYGDEFLGGNYAGYMYDLLSGLCLSWDPTTAPTNLQMVACVKGDIKQQWNVDQW